MSRVVVDWFDPCWGDHLSGQIAWRRGNGINDLLEALSMSTRRNWSLCVGDHWYHCRYNSCHRCTSVFDDKGEGLSCNSGRSVYKINTGSELCMFPSQNCRFMILSMWASGDSSCCARSYTGRFILNNLIPEQIPFIRYSGGSESRIPINLQGNGFIRKTSLCGTRFDIPELVSAIKNGIRYY
ncbi:MAG TPA: hypothetical protein PKA63_09950 [Oligoflexia bacterium]|nr:hypothetical protein [Oligoflexia bacterium]HMP48978.1 hypothetical protein [Oligoflexia bacterium]